MHVRRRLAPLLGLVLLLTACGAGATIDPQVLLSGAPAAARDAGSAAVEMTIEMSGAMLPDGATILASGSIDWASGQSLMTMDMSSIMEELGTSSVIVTRDALYIRNAMMTQLGDVDWVVVRYADIGELGDLGIDLGLLLSESQGSDPTAFLDQLYGAGQEITDLGSEPVRDVTTTHYRATIDTAAAAARARELGQVTTAQTLESLIEADALPATYAVDVWVDGDGLPRRMLMALTQSQGGEEITVTLTMDLFDFGAGVTIEVPSDATSVTDLLGGGVS